MTPKRFCGAVSLTCPQATIPRNGAPGWRSSEGAKPWTQWPRLGPHPGVTRIAHLSDAHILDPRPSRTRSGWSMRVRFLSFGRPLDAAGRRDEAEAVARHRAAGGRAALRPVGGPHRDRHSGRIRDARRGPPRFGHRARSHDPRPGQSRHVHVGRRVAVGARRATRGVRRGRARESPGAGKIVEVAGASLLPLDATFHQPVTRSAGLMPDDAIESIERRAGGSRAREEAAGGHPAPPAVRPQDERPALARRPGGREPHDEHPREVPAPLGPPRPPARDRRPRPRLRRIAHPRRDRGRRRPGRRRACASTTSATAGSRRRASSSAERSPARGLQGPFASPDTRPLRRSGRSRIARRDSGCRPTLPRRAGASAPLPPASPRGYASIARAGRRRPGPHVLGAGRHERPCATP